MKGVLLESGRRKTGERLETLKHQRGRPTAFPASSQRYTERQSGPCTPRSRGGRRFLPTGDSGERKRTKQRNVSKRGREERSASFGQKVS